MLDPELERENADLYLGDPRYRGSDEELETYQITLYVTREPEHDTPENWEWQKMMELRHPVEVVDITRVG